MLTLTDRGLTLQVNNPASLTTAHYFQSKQCVIVGTEIAGHGGLVATVSGYFIEDECFLHLLLTQVACLQYFQIDVVVLESYLRY